MTMYAYTVTLNGIWVDKIFYTSNVDPDDVKSSLVTHDGYDPDIVVMRERKRKNSTKKATHDTRK